MAAALTAITNAQVGKPMTIAATGFAATHAITVSIVELGVVISGTTDGSGNFSTSVVTPQNNTPFDIIVNDGTTTLTEHVTVASE